MSCLILNLFITLSTVVKMKELYFEKLIAFLMCSIFLSGCTSLGSYIISNPDVYLSEAEFISKDPKEMGFIKRKFCTERSNRCIAYLSAPSYQPSDFAADGAAFYKLHATGNGVENIIAHRMTPDTFNRFKGTAILLHGYGGKKEVMLAAAIYFRGIGMNVIIPDLFGHGESEEDFAFAAREHIIITELLAELGKDNKEVEPVVVVGHSMGALLATNLLLSKQVNSAILLAPMMRFDLAAKQYLPYKAPMLNKVISSHINDIIEETMSKVSVSLPETDLLKTVDKTSKSILLINSTVDSVSPPDYFSSISNENVKKVTLKDRSHSSLMVFSKEDARIVEDWLVEQGNLFSW